jgi:alcohol dehydrogenase (cytochrome c)
MQVTKTVTQQRGWMSISLVVVLAASGLAMAASSSSKPLTGATPSGTGSWPFPNGNLANTRVAASSTISSANVSKLAEAWTFQLSGVGATSVGGVGSLVSNPIVLDGVVYVQDLESNVYALSLRTGKLKWEHTLDQELLSGPGPNGVDVVDGTVYGTSPNTVFALNANTGRSIWVNNHLLSTGEGVFGIQPQVANGRVYVASQYGSGPGGGVLLALQASTGAELWRFNTVLGAAQGEQAAGLGTGGAWETPLVGTDGSVTYGIGNPYQSAASAIAHPSAQLYTDSDVNLDAATGKLRWYYQGVPNDFMDHDMQSSPIAVTVDGTRVVIGGGKMGYVYEMNARTGKLIWKTPVGEHNGQDNDGVEALEHKLILKVPYTVLPGTVGGLLSNMAVAGNTVYVATDDWAFKFTSLKEVLPEIHDGQPAGQVEALNLATGKVEWDTKVASLPLGGATVSNDLVFTTLFTGELIALNRETGAIVYHAKLPTSTNAPLAIAGNTVIVAAGGLDTASFGGAGGRPQVAVYTVP